MGRRRKVLFTFEKLDALLGRTGKPDGPDRLTAWLPTSVNVRVVANLANRSDLELEYWDTCTRFPIASVWSVEDGGTVYEVNGCGADLGKNREGRRLFRRYVRWFTPHTVQGRTPRFERKHWYRLYDGVAVEITRTHGSVWKPFYSSRLYPKCAAPRLSEWVQPGVEKGLPKFVARSRAFYKNLRREVATSVPAAVQLLNQRQARANSSKDFTWSLRTYLFLQVCTPPSSHDRGRQLVVAMEPHDADSRTFFKVNGDYCIRHSQFRACEPPNREIMRWRCAREAIVGIKEWLLGSIFIPGPE